MLINHYNIRHELAMVKGTTGFAMPSRVAPIGS